MATAYHVGKQGEGERGRSAGKWQEKEERLMTHTQEPWKDGVKGRLSFQIMGANGDYVCSVAGLQNKDRIITCINSCAGLNPSAYRECVEAAKDLLHHLTALEQQERLVSDAYTNTLRRAVDEAVQHALANAREEG